MSWIILIVIVLIIAGIVLLSRQPSGSKKTRKEFWDELQKYLDAQLEPIPEYENSYRVRFTYEGQEFVFEEIEMKGFQDVVLKGYLRAQTPTKLNLAFSEKKTARSFRAEEEGSGRKVSLPQPLQTFNAFTNNRDLCNKLMGDSKIAALFVSLKNVDSRGYPIMPIRIENGLVSLEFNSAKMIQPNLNALKNSVSSIEDYLEKMSLIVDKLREKE